MKDPQLLSSFNLLAVQENLSPYRAWLTTDYGLGTGHARTAAHVILHGPEFTVKKTTGRHHAESGILNLKRKKATKTKTAYNLLLRV